jgi:mono/diheme cytochrome c family protein
MAAAAVVGNLEGFVMARCGSRSWALLVAGTSLIAWATIVATSYSDDQPADWIAPPIEARKPNPVPADAAAIAAGKDVFTKNCMPCHGTAGKGDGPAAFALTQKPRDLSNPKIAVQSDGSIFWKLTTGKAPMPSFEKLIPETQRWQVIDYVRTLQPKAGPAASEPASQPATQPK